MIGRIPVLDISPLVAAGSLPAKAAVDELIPVSATVFREGHDSVAADVVVRGPKAELLSRTPMTPGAPGTDRFTAWIRPQTQGLHSFTIEAWTDPYATWRHRATIKIDAGIDVDLELQEGAALLARVMEQVPAKSRKPLSRAIAIMNTTSLEPTQRLSAALDREVTTLIHTYPLRDLLTGYGPYPLRVERKRALFGAWYEFFPRSEGGFKGSIKRLQAIADMGFNVVYLPPIHPIGRINRKGPNNTLSPGPKDPGSPWAIGSTEGGHDAIHPELGTSSDFIDFVKAAKKLGIEVALDLALQAAPDHPWVKEHPEWFTTRADGTIAYAENPPKKYQDIYPINFDNDFDGLFNEVLRIIKVWIAKGVTIFRVDNPHTKPVHFWHKIISAVNDQYPDVIFLAEAFTRPPMMRVLAEVGFQQSYTYFTWRNDRHGLTDYFNELAGPASAYMRPNVWPNTPDILPEFLQYGGPGAFAIRAVLASTLSPTWGMYSGFELFEHVAVRPGSEEYLDSEKYQLKSRDWAAAAKGTTLIPLITTLNRIRNEHKALHHLRNLTFHHTSTDRLIAYSKRDGDDVILVVVALDPHGACEGSVALNMTELGLSDDASFTVKDLLSDQAYRWGRENYIRLDPRVQAAHVFSVSKDANS